MARILAIDYGTKRCGLAVTDPLQLTAQGLDTVSAQDVLDFIQKYTGREPVERFVVGEARNLDGTPAESASHIEGFVKRLHKAFPDTPISRVDERFTSKMASHAISQSGMGKKKRQDKALVDKVSAVLILQSYLERQQFLP